MRLTRMLIGILFILVGCVNDTYIPTDTPITATPVPLCDIWQPSTRAITCISSDAMLLAQSNLEQVTLRAYQASIVLHGTILIINNDDHLQILVLEGDAIIGARGQNRVLSLGQQISLPLIDAISDFPSEITAIINPPDILSLEALPRSIDVQAFIITATPQPTIIPTIAPERCPPPQTWRGQYMIASGDTLAAIANQYDLTIAELAEANCLTNIARITVGQLLNVPIDNTSGQLNSAPVAIGFRADAYAISRGTCTTLRWDAFGVQGIYLDDVPVNEGGSQEICLEETQSFTLRVVYENDAEERRELTISVQE